MCLFKKFHLLCPFLEVPSKMFIIIIIFYVLCSENVTASEQKKKQKMASSSTVNRRVYGIEYHHGWKNWGTPEHVRDNYHPHAMIICYFLPANVRFKYATTFDGLDQDPANAGYVRNNMRLWQIWCNFVSLSSGLQGADAKVASDTPGQPCSSKFLVSIPCICPIYRTENKGGGPLLEKKVYVGHLFHATYSLGREQYTHLRKPDLTWVDDNGRIKTKIEPVADRKIRLSGKHALRMKLDIDYCLGYRFGMNRDEDLKSNVADVAALTELSLLNPSFTRSTYRKSKHDTALDGPPSGSLVSRTGSTPIASPSSGSSVMSMLSNNELSVIPVLGEDRRDHCSAWTYMNFDIWYKTAKDYVATCPAAHECYNALFTLSPDDAKRGAKVSPIAPSKVFSLASGLYAMEQAGADAVFCKSESWYDGEADREIRTPIRFPNDGEGFYRVSHNSLLPDDIIGRLVPEYERPKLSRKDRAVRHKMRQLISIKDRGLLEADPVVMSTANKVILDRVEKLALHEIDTTFSMTNDDGSIEYFNSYAKAKLHPFRIAREEDVTDQFILEEKSITDELVMRFRERIWDKSNPSITNADRLIRAHLDKIESDNRGSIFPKDVHKFCTRFNNLDILCGFIATFLMILERDVAAFQCHSDVIMLFLASLHVHSDANMHVHVIMGGRAEGGKSFAVQVLTLFLLIGTYLQQTSQTNKANYVASNVDCHRQVVVQEEFDSAKLGVPQTPGEHRRKGKESGFNGAQNSSMGSGPEAVRDQITRNRIDHVRLERGPDGKFVKSTIGIPNHQVLVYCGNVIRDDLTFNMLSRFLFYLINPQSRLDGETMQKKMTKTKESPSEKLLWLIDMTRMLQCLACYIYKNINATIIQSPDKSLSDIVTLFLLDQLKTLGAVGTEESRNFVRVRCFSEIFSILDAILRLVFVAPTSKKFTWPWFAHAIKPLLVVTIQQVILAFSLTMVQYDTIKVGKFIKEFIAEAGGPATDASAKEHKRREQERTRREKEDKARKIAEAREAKKAEKEKHRLGKQVPIKDILQSNRNPPPVTPDEIVASTPTPAAHAHSTAAASLSRPTTDHWKRLNIPESKTPIVPRAVVLEDGDLSTMDVPDFKRSSVGAGSSASGSGDGVIHTVIMPDYQPEIGEAMRRALPYYSFEMDEPPPPPPPQFVKGGSHTHGMSQPVNDETRVEALVTNLLTRAGVRGTHDEYINHIKTWLTIKDPHTEFMVLSFHPIHRYYTPPPINQSAIGGVRPMLQTTARKVEVRLSRQFCTDKMGDRNRLLDAVMSLLVKDNIPLQDYAIMQSPDGLPVAMTIITKEDIIEARNKIKNDRHLSEKARASQLASIFRNSESRDGVIDAILDQDGSEPDVVLAQLEKELKNSLGSMEKSRFIQWDSCPVELAVLKRIRSTLKWNSGSVLAMGWKSTVDETVPLLTPYNLDKFWAEFSEAKLRYPPEFTKDDGLPKDGIFDTTKLAKSSVAAYRIKASLGMKLTAEERKSLERTKTLMITHAEAITRTKSTMLVRRSSKTRIDKWGGLPPAVDDTDEVEMPTLEVKEDSKSPIANDDDNDDDDGKYEGKGSAGHGLYARFTARNAMRIRAPVDHEDDTKSLPPPTPPPPPAIPPPISVPVPEPNLRRRARDDGDGDDDTRARVQQQKRNKQSHASLPHYLRNMPTPPASPTDLDAANHDDCEDETTIPWTNSFN